MVSYVWPFLSPDRKNKMSQCSILLLGNGCYFVTRWSHIPANYTKAESMNGLSCAPDSREKWENLRLTHRILVFLSIVFVQIVTWLLKLLKILDKGQFSLKVLGYTLSFRQLFCSLILANHFRWLNKYVCVMYGSWTLIFCLCFHRGNSFDSRRFCQGPEILQICWQCFAVWRCEHCCAESTESPQVTDDRQRMMPLSAGFITCT